MAHFSLAKYKYYVVYSNGKTPNFIESNKVNTLTQEEIYEINKTIINNSYVKCIGMNKLPLEQSLKSYTYQSPSRSIMAYKSGVKTASLNKKEVFFYQDDIDVNGHFFSAKNTTIFSNSFGLISILHRNNVLNFLHIMGVEFFYDYFF